MKTVKKIFSEIDKISKQFNNTIDGTATEIQRIAIPRISIPRNCESLNSENRHRENISKKIAQTKIPQIVILRISGILSSCKF